MTEKTLAISQQPMEISRALCGLGDGLLDILQQETNTRIMMREQAFTIEGETEEDALAARQSLKALAQMLQKGEAIDATQVRYVVALARSGELDLLSELSGEVVSTTFRGKQIKAKTLGQRTYLRSIRENPLTFGIGPAGTGKTYLAVAMAVNALRAKEVERIVLTRPAVEAGEKLGFLPGDLSQKVDPYLRPLFDALQEMLGMEAFLRQMERGAIEIAPMAYMRGRTLSDAFIILDEAQNTTGEQMKMFLTRMGFHSRMVVNGDITQIDLGLGRGSGLVEAVKVLDDTPDVGIVRLTERDVVRHDLVQRIVRAYDAYARRASKHEAKPEEKTE